MTINLSGGGITFHPDPDALALGRVFAQTASPRDVLTVNGVAFRLPYPAQGCDIEIAPAARGPRMIGDCGEMVDEDDLERLASVLLGMAEVVRDNREKRHEQMKAEQATEQGSQAAERGAPFTSLGAMHVGIAPATHSVTAQAAYNGEEPNQ